MFLLASEHPGGQKVEMECVTFGPFLLASERPQGLEWLVNFKALPKIAHVKGTGGLSARINEMSVLAICTESQALSIQHESAPGAMSFKTCKESKGLLLSGNPHANLIAISYGAVRG
jgi:hypothetical protein